MKGKKAWLTLALVIASVVAQAAGLPLAEALHEAAQQLGG